MRQEELLRERPPTAIARVGAFVWIVCVAIFAFTSENLWIDPWIHGRMHRLPSFVPEPLGTVWVLVLTVLVMALLLAAVALILLVRDGGVPLRQKIAGAVALLVALALCVAWAVTTSGAGTPMMDALFHRHRVILKWNASTSPVLGYNVYRAEKAGGYDFKHPLNESLVQDTTYTDKRAKSGRTYFYVTRSRDSRGLESVNSNEIQVDVP